MGESRPPWRIRSAGRGVVQVEGHLGSDAVATLGPAGARSHPAASRCRGAASARTACTHGGSHWRSAPLRVERSPSDPFKPSMGLLRRPTPGKIVGPLRAKSWRADDAAGPAGRARIRAHLRNQVTATPPVPHFRITEYADDKFWSPAALLVIPPLAQAGCRPGCGGPVAPRDAECSGEHTDNAPAVVAARRSGPTASTAR